VENESREYKIEIGIADNGLSASIKIVPTAGEVMFIDEGDMIESLSHAGVIFGLLPDTIRKVIEEKIINTTIEIARGEPAGEGQDGYVRFHFEKDGKKVDLKEDASGRVNFKDMNLIQNVRRGDILCELVPPETGPDGITVRGEPVHGTLGAAAKLPGGKNVESGEGGTRLLSTIDGMVMFNDPEVIVEPIYVVDKVDSSTGNIRFNGSVVINGEVGDGFEIHAAEDVTISMSVGRVIIDAGGSIKIAGGILGQDKAHLTAKGSIRLKFVQDSHLSAGKEIIVDDYIRSSQVTACGPIIVKSSSGWISGGLISSEGWIYCNTIGLAANPMDTRLTIGHNPAYYQERESLQDDIIEKIGDFLKLQASLLKLRALKAKDQLTQPQLRLYEKIMSAVDTIRHQLIEKDARYQELSDKINTVFAGNIYIEGACNEGTKLAIGNAMRDIHHIRRQVQFSLKEGNIEESEFVMLPDIKNFLESE
jgi:uncharacterized protein